MDGEIETEVPKIKRFKNIVPERKVKYLVWAAKQADRLHLELRYMHTAGHPIRNKLAEMKIVLKYLETEEVFSRQFAPNLEGWMPKITDSELRQAIEKQKAEIVRILDGNNPLRMSEVDYLGIVFENLGRAESPQDIEKVRAEAEKNFRDVLNSKELAEQLSKFSEVRLMKESHFIRELDTEIRSRSVEPKKLGEAVEILEREYDDKKLAGEIGRYKEDFPHPNQIENLRQRHNEISPDGGNFIEFMRPYLRDNSLVQRNFMDVKIQKYIEEMSARVIAFGYLNMISASINREFAQKDWPVFKRFIDNPINFEALVKRFKDGYTIGPKDLAQGYNGLAGRFMHDAEIAMKLEELKAKHSTIADWAMRLAEFIRERQVRLAQETIHFIQRRIEEMDKAVASIENALERKLAQLSKQEKNIKQLLMTRIDLRRHNLRNKINAVRNDWLRIAKNNFDTLRTTANKMREFLKDSLEGFHTLMESYAVKSVSAFAKGKEAKVISKVEMDIINYAYNLAVDYWYWYNYFVYGKDKKNRPAQTQRTNTAEIKPA